MDDHIKILETLEKDSDKQKECLERDLKEKASIEYEKYVKQVKKRSPQEKADARGMPSSIKALHDPGWSFEVSKKSLEYPTRRTFIAILGPPQSGKTFFVDRFIRRKGFEPTFYTPSSGIEYFERSSDPSTIAITYSPTQETDPAVDDLVQDAIIKLSSIVIIMVDQLTRQYQNLAQKLKQTTNKTIVVIHNWKNEIDQKEIEVLIRSEIEEACNTFKLPSEVGSLRSENNNIYLYLEASKEAVEQNDKEKIVHLILANEGTSAGDYYNLLTYRWLANKLNVTHKPNEKAVMVEFMNSVKEVLEEIKAKSFAFDLSLASTGYLQSSIDLSNIPGFGNRNEKQRKYKGSYRVEKLEQVVRVIVSEPWLEKSKRPKLVINAGNYFLELHISRSNPRHPEGFSLIDTNSYEGEELLKIPIGGTDEFHLGDIQAKQLKNGFLECEIEITKDDPEDIEFVQK